MNLHLLSFAAAGFGFTFLVGHYLRYLGVSLDSAFFIPLFGSLATVIPGLWGIYSWADERLSSAEDSIERSQLKLEGEIARLEARVQILLENRLMGDKNR